MEGGKQVGSDCSGSSSSSSSSFTSELFGSRDSSSSSSGIFGAIFAPNPSKVVGRESLCPEMDQKRCRSTAEASKADPESSGDLWKTKNGEEKQSKPSIGMSSIYQEHNRVQPCHLSSSIFYGGQDNYTRPQNSHSSGFNSTKLKKDGSENDSERGNWWQGSLYY